VTERKTMVDEFYLDLALCSYCGICVDVCPYEAIEMTPEFAYSSTDVRSMVLDKGELVQIARGMSRTTVNPPNSPGAPKPLTAVETPEPAPAEDEGDA
jgi:NADH-quinone oxidoreductase subunit I